MRRRYLLLALGLAHAGVLGVGFLHDDLFHYLHAFRTAGVGPALAEMWTPRRGEEFYRPLTETTYALTYLLVGTRPFLYRLTDLALHAVAVLLVLHLARRLTGSRAAGYVAAWLLALHPLAGRAVLWTSDRYVLLATVLGWAALAAYLRHRSGGGKGWAAAAVALAGGGLLAKESAAALPLVVAAVEILGPERRLRRVVPFLLLLGLYLLGRVLTLGDLGGYRDRMSGAVLLPLSVAAAARELFRDFPAALLYPVNRAAVPPRLQALAGLALGAALLGLVRHGWGRWPPDRRRAAVLGLLLTLLPLAPSLPYFYLGRDLLKAYHTYPTFLGVGILAWSLLGSPRGRPAFAVLLLAYAALDQLHARPWREATALVARLREAAARVTPPLRVGVPGFVAGVPQHWRGALVVAPNQLGRTLTVLLERPVGPLQGLGYPWCAVTAAGVRRALARGGRYFLFDPLRGRLRERTNRLRARPPAQVLIRGGRPRRGAWTVEGPAARRAAGWYLPGRAARFRWRGPPLRTGRHWVLTVRLRARRLDGGPAARANLRWTDRHYGPGGAHRLARWRLRCDGRFHTYRIELLRTGWVAEEVPVRTWTLSPGRTPMVVEVDTVAWGE